MTTRIQVDVPHELWKDFTAWRLARDPAMQLTRAAAARLLIAEGIATWKKMVEEDRHE